MDKNIVFQGELINTTDNNYTEFCLPSTCYELQDTLERARLDKDGKTRIDMTDYTRFRFLRPFLAELNNLYELNALAEKLAQMESWKVDAFEGLLLMECNKQEQISLSRIYDLASSAGECQVLYDARTDEELGHFYVENGFVPETDNLPDAIYELLDYRKIGKQMRVGEGGVFLQHGSGYVTQVGDLKEEFKMLDLTPKQPDYTVLLEVGLPDRADPMLLKLPASRKTLEDVPKRFEARGWCDLTWRCADCRIPSLCDAISTTDNIVFINYAAIQLAEIPKDQLKGCKALLEATQFRDLTDATMILDQRDEYVFSPQYDSPEALAKDELKRMMGDENAELAIPHLNLYRYGETLMEAHKQVMTAYGVIGRHDRQPIQTMQEQHWQTQPTLGGMEMM